MVFFHYCVVSNYFWLFIEGLYLFTLLVETFFPERRYFYWYIIIGWGRSLIVAWTGSGPMTRILCPAIREYRSEEGSRGRCCLASQLRHSAESWILSCSSPCREPTG